MTNSMQNVSILEMQLDRLCYLRTSFKIKLIGSLQAANIL